MVHAGQLWINNSWALGNTNLTKYNWVQDDTSGVDAELHLNGTNGNIILPPSFVTMISNPLNEGAIVNEAGNNIINGMLGLVSGGGGYS